MGIATPVFRLYRSRGTGGCEHHLLARASRPSYPNHDAAVEEAADAFATSALDHLTGWWTHWLLPATCDGSHEHDTVGETSHVAADDGIDLWDGPGLREVDLWFATGRDVLVIGATHEEEVFWLGVGDEPELESRALTRPARQVRVDFLTDLDGGGDLRDLVDGP